MILDFNLDKLKVPTQEQFAGINKLKTINHSKLGDHQNFRGFH